MQEENFHINGKDKIGYLERVDIEHGSRYSCQIGRLKHVYPPPGMEHLNTDDDAGVFMQVPDV